MLVLFIFHTDENPSLKPLLKCYNNPKVLQPKKNINVLSSFTVLKIYYFLPFNIGTTVKITLKYFPVQLSIQQFGIEKSKDVKDCL